MTTTVETPTATSLDQQSIVLKSYRPIIFDADSSIIFDVDLDEDYLSPILPYIGFLSVTRHWRYNLDLELWLLPEGMEEAELLGYEFYKTNAVLNGERLFVSHDHVAEFIQAQDLMDSIVANQHISPDEYSGSKTVNYTAPFELQKWSKKSFIITFRDKTASDVVSQYPADLIRAAKISHLNGRGFLSKALSPHKILNRPIEDLDHSLLPCCLDVQPKSPARVLVFSSKEPFFQRNGIETTMPIPKLWNIVKSLRVCSWECDCDYFEVFGSLNIIYLLSRYFNCIPVSGLACGFDSRLDLTENWEQDSLPGADVLISEEVRAEVERISHGWKRRAEPAVYHVTHRYRHDKDACFKSDRPIQELKETLFYLIGIAAIMFEDNLCGPLQHEELLSESICFLLQQYYDFELCPYQEGAVELDLYYLWEFDEDLQRTDPEWDLELHQKYGRAGVIDCIGMLMRGEFEVGIGEDCQLEVKSNHPKTNPPESLIPTSNGDDFKAIQDYQSRSSNDQGPVDDYFDDSPDIDELEYSDRIVESNNQQDEDQKKDLSDFVGAMEEHINKLPANERNDYVDQLEQIKAADSLPELKDRVNQLSRDLYAKSYDTIQYDIAMMTAISEGVVSKQPENITEQLQELDDTQRTETPAVPAGQPTQNIFWITHECSYLHSKMTCVTHPTKTHAQAKRDAYYIIYEGYDNYEINDVEPRPETVCHLLVKYYGYEICEYDETATEIDLLYIWQGPRDPDLKVRDKSWLKWLELSRFRWGFYPELISIMDGSLDINSLSQYPWNQQHESITGWDCGDYVIEVPFCLFNSKSEAEEFGESCYALEPYEEYCNLLKLLYIDPYGDRERTSIRKDDCKVFLRSSIFDIRSGDLRDRDEWELVPMDAWDTPNLVIGAQLYCQGRDVKGGLHNAD